MATSDRDVWHRWQMDDLDSVGGDASQVGSSHGKSSHANAQPQRGDHHASDSQKTDHESDPENPLDAQHEALREAHHEAHRQGLEAGQREGREQGYQDGHAEGFAEGRAVAAQAYHQQVQETLKPLETLVNNFQQALAVLDDDVANQLVELALITGRQLAGEALDASPATILARVRELLDADSSLNGRTRLWLHPQDLELVSETLGDSLAAAGWECQPDPSLERGGCRATNPSGGLDASLETQWQAILDQRRQRPRDVEEASSDASRQQVSSQEAAMQSDSAQSDSIRSDRQHD